ncbi:MAG: hypothetical protein KIH64_004340 [Mycobacterium sp.]|nr:hypothetical protein [Mycobacterium sp.]
MDLELLGALVNTYADDLSALPEAMRPDAIQLAACLCGPLAVAAIMGAALPDRQRTIPAANALPAAAEILAHLEERTPLAIRLPQWWDFEALVSDTPSRHRVSALVSRMCPVIVWKDAPELVSVASAIALKFGAAFVAAIESDE